MFFRGNVGDSNCTGRYSFLSATGLAFGVHTGGIGSFSIFFRFSSMGLGCGGSVGASAGFAGDHTPENPRKTI